MIYKVIRSKAIQYLFDTIEDARECRERLMDMGYNNISIEIEQEDLP
jgi:Fe2+ transport system protein FeoA